MRLSEFLERHYEFVVHEATIERLRDGVVSRVRQLTMARDDVFAVETAAAAAVGGGSDRRIHTVRHVVHFVCGPYDIYGELHALPGVPPMRQILNRRSMVPLTDCAVTFQRGGGIAVRRAPVVVVNGGLIDLAEPARIEDLDPALASLLSA